MATVILVGCDKVGKTTLFEAILKETNRHICIDRFAACQYVYGNYHGKEDTPSIADLRYIEQKMAESGAFYVHATAYGEEVKARFKTHSEKDIEPEFIDQILDDYEVYMKDAKMPVLRINTSRMTIEEAVTEIITFADNIDHDCELGRSFNPLFKPRLKPRTHRKKEY